MKQFFWWITGCCLMSACTQRNIENLIIKGSDTELNLVLELAETYMDNDPNASISISGGGSGVGITALLNHRTDIANSSRALNDEEIALGSRQGMQLVSTVFASDALAVIVHPEVGLTQISLENLGKIYAGDIKNWKELGGKDGRISLYGRQSNSGTFMYFREKVLGRDFSQDLKQLNGTAQMLESVKLDPNGIGFVGFGYLFGQNGDLYPGISVLALQADPKAAAVSPLDKQAILSGLYPLTRPLYQITDGPPTGKALDFIRFELSKTGQAVIARSGYLPPVPETDLAEKH